MTTLQRVLVTGGGGFIGGALCEGWLARGAHVLALDDFSAGNTRLLSVKHDRLQVVRATVENTATVCQVVTTFKPDIMYHLAALHYIPACDADPRRALDVNVCGTESVLLAAQEGDVGQLVFASTSAVYADSDDPYTESYTTAPRDIYGLTKLFGEYLCRHFHTTTGRSTTVCRFFNAYGPGDTVPHIIPEILKQLARTGDTLQLGNLSPRRDFIFITDLVDALIGVTRVIKGSFDVFNIGSGVDCSIQELVQLIEEALGQKLKVRTDESRIRRIERPRLMANISKIRQAIGWNPKVELRRGLLETINAHPQLRAETRRAAKS
jgi:UDP-glucose 4-epimerase